MSDIDIYINGGFEPDEVEEEIEAIDQVFVPTIPGKCTAWNSDKVTFDVSIVHMW